MYTNEAIGYCGHDMFVITATALGTSESLYQCTHSREQVYTPNIPDFYFSHMNPAVFTTVNLTASQHGVTYIFTIPSESPLRNCTGTVVNLEFCYQARNEDKRKRIEIFKFLSLIQNGSKFSVSRRFNVSTNPQRRICTNPPMSSKLICCDVKPLGSRNNKVSITSTNFTFGIVIQNQHARLLAFGPSATKYHAEQYQVALGFRHSRGATFMLNESTLLNNQSLLLLRFLLGKSN